MTCRRDLCVFAAVSSAEADDNNGQPGQMADLTVADKDGDVKMAL